MLLAAFEYTIEFISGKHKMDADFSSRKPIKSGRHTGEQVSEYVMFMKGDQFLYTLVVVLKTKKISSSQQTVAIYLAGLAR